MLRSSQGVVVDGAVLSDPGRDPEKQVNEDAAALTETGFGVVGVVCDGMGGHERGELASRTAVERILEVLRAGGQPLDRLLSSAIERAHAEVYALGGAAPIDARPGSTAVVVLLAGREVLVGHVGDSRAYRIRARRLERLTRDHSVVEALLAAGAITPEQANAHPDANRITRALGIAPEIEPEVSPPVHAEPGDAFVLCTDGLSDLVTEGEISEIVSSSASPEGACEALVKLANQRGGHDNVTVEVLRVLAVGAARGAGETLGQTAVAPKAGATTAFAAHPVPKTVGLSTDGPPTAPEGQTIVAQPGFTVLMGTKDVSPRARPEEAARAAAPTLVDPLIAAELPHKTLPGHDVVPPAPPAATPGAFAAPPATEVGGTQALPAPPLPAPHAQPPTGFVADPNAPRATLDAVPDVPSIRAPREGEVRLLIWTTVVICALVLLLVVVWWLLRD